MSDTKTCPYCAETIRAEAVKCRFCGSIVEPDAMRALASPWVRPRRGRMIAGVCAGLSQQFGISVTIIRLAFLLGVLFSGGVVVLLYIALWIAMPSEEDVEEERRARTAELPPGPGAGAASPGGSGASAARGGADASAAAGPAGSGAGSPPGAGAGAGPSAAGAPAGGAGAPGTPEAGRPLPPDADRA